MIEFFLCWLTIVQFIHFLTNLSYSLLLSLLFRYFFLLICNFLLSKFVIFSSLLLLMFMASHFELEYWFSSILLFVLHSNFVSFILACFEVFVDSFLNFTLHSLSNVSFDFLSFLTILNCILSPLSLLTLLFF